MGVPDYEQVWVATTKGRTRVDCAFRLGDAAVTRALDGDGWTITHLPSGFACMATFASAGAAEEALKEIDRIVDWSGLVQTVAAGRFPNYTDEVRAICERYGGACGETNTSGTPRFAAQLRRMMGWGG